MNGSWLIALVALAGVAPGQDVDDGEVRAAWRDQPPEDREEIARWFVAECQRLDTFQAVLMRYLIDQLERDRYAWDEAPERAPLYDAAKHAPGQPIERTWLPEDSPKVAAWQERVLSGVPERRLRIAWRYDWGTGEVVRVGPEFDAHRIFQNGLAGIPPDLDLAEALVERMLDDGRLREVHAAFGHGYADRRGKAYPGVTLYDVWCAGVHMEMPDVECLGIVHDVLDDWKTWKAPIPASRHDQLYGRLGEIFQSARRHRGMRTALARSYLQATPVMRDGYGPSIDRLHGLWELHESDPEALAKALPEEDEEWEEWWANLYFRIDKVVEVVEKARVRRRTLESNAGRVRGVLVAVMREYGAL